ncbi:MAG TPA: hypothetical protein VFY45_15300 [Baekduia sp.]|nr:hypothetical protein [Baekduia sp.]
MAPAASKRRARSLRHVRPNDRLNALDWLWPQMHGRFWYYDRERDRELGFREIYASLPPVEDESTARDQLVHVDSIAQSALDRAGAADRRATTISGTVAIAASFTISGAGLILDDTKVPDPRLQRLLMIVLTVTTVAFVISAVYALRALVATRKFDWPHPGDLKRVSATDAVERLQLRAALSLHDFAYNWEVSELKNRCVDRAGQLLVIALLGLATLAGLLVTQVA